MARAAAEPWQTTVSTDRKTRRMSSCFNLMRTSNMARAILSPQKKKKHTPRSLRLGVSGMSVSPRPAAALPGPRSGEKTPAKREAAAIADRVSTPDVTVAGSTISSARELAFSGDGIYGCQDWGLEKVDGGIENGSFNVPETTVKPLYLVQHRRKRSLRSGARWRTQRREVLCERGKKV